MNRESFINSLRQQYLADIHEAYSECLHAADQVDFEQLSRLLSKLMQNAEVDGLSRNDFEELLQNALPEVCKKVILTTEKPAKKSA